MNIRGVMIDVSAGCPRCKQPFHLNGAAASTICPSCQQTIDLRPDFWQSILGDAVTEAAGMQEQEGRNSTIMHGASGLTLKMQYGRLAARCAPCKEPYALDAIGNALPPPGSEAEGSVHCGKCGKGARVRRPPKWFVDAVHPAVVALVGETLAAFTAGTEKAAGPQKMHCYGCGAPLQVDGASRNIACQYCSQAIMIPDDVWLRLHPAPTSERWYVLIDLGDAVGLVPEDSDRFCDLTLSPQYEMVVAWHAEENGEAGHPCRVGAINANGMFRWIQDGVEFEEYTTLLVSPADGQIALVDKQGGFIRWLDSKDGRPLKTVQGPKESVDEDVFCVYQHSGVQIDVDGSILVKRHVSRHGEVLRRFARDGTPMPLWSGGKAKLTDERPEWTKLPQRPGSMPSEAQIYVGWDGNTYLVHRKLEHIAQLARDGTVRGVLSLGTPPVYEVEAFAVDRAGTMYVLFEHSTEIGTSKWPHLARVTPQSGFQVWLGPHVPGSPPLGAYSRMMECSPEGTLYIGYDFGSLRVIGPDGSLIWRSPKTKSNDEYQEKDLAEARRAKRVVADAES